MSFADWKKRSDLYEPLSERSLQAAYKAGVREGEARGKGLLFRAYQLQEALKRQYRSPENR